jgi:GNAT superfamily N-acetyltransferase
MHGQGIGRKLIDTINYMFVTNNRTGCKFITVDAYKQSVKFYEKLGFTTFTDKDIDLDTRAMYLELSPLN